MNTEKKDKIRARLHTTISSETEEILNKYATLKDKNGKKIYGNKSRVIEKALDLLDKFHFPEKEHEQVIWNRAKNELKMLMVGKPTFLAYISGNYKQVYEDNIAIDIIEWYTQKNIEDLSIEATLNAIKDIWIAGNYFYDAKIEKGNKGSYIMLLYHDFQNKTYSEFWGNYFSLFLSRQKNCNVDYFIRTSFLRLVITPSDKVNLSQNLYQYSVGKDKYKISESIEVW
ncbi:MAG: hypothetical protein ACFFAT_17225 [Promethearchaeota archaeon]